MDPISESSSRTDRVCCELKSTDQVEERECIDGILRSRKRVRVKGPGERGSRSHGQINGRSAAGSAAVRQRSTSL